MPIRDASFYAGLLDDPNVQGALAAIREAEGTARRADPYSVGFGFTELDNLDAHPGRTLGSFRANGRTQRSSAAGAYQFLDRTWREVSDRLGITNFGRREQDIAALAKIDERGALGDVLRGDIDGFVQKTNREWASLPGSPYGQPTKSIGTLKDAWAGAREDAVKRAPTKEDARLGDAWGYQDPTATRGLTTPANTPMPSTMLGDIAGVARARGGAMPTATQWDRNMTGGLLGDVPSPTARASNPTRPGLPTPMSRPSPSMAAPSTLSAGVQERMTGIPMSDRQITASIPDMPAASAMLSRTAPSINPQPPMERPTAMAGLSPAVRERMGGFPDAPAPTQRAATPDLAPSVMERMGGLLSMDAKAATMPNSRANGLLSDTPPAQPFGRPDAIAYADPVPSRPAPSVPSYQAPPASYQTPAFSTAKPQMDALGQPPIPGLQRAPQRQAAAPVPDVPAYTAPRDVAPAPTIAGPVGRQRAEQAPTRSNIPSPTADRNAAQAAAAAALSEVSSRGKSGGMFSGGFSGPSGVMGGAMLGGTVAGLPGAAIGGLLGSKTVRDSIGLGGLGGGSGYGTGQLSAGALSALNAGWGGFGGMTPTQQLAVGLAQQQQAEAQAQAARAGLFDGWGISGNQASSSAIGGRTTSYRDGRTSKTGGGEGGFGSGSMSDSARSSAQGGGGLF